MVVLLPWQIVSFAEVTFMAGPFRTVTETFAVSAHTPFNPITVYVVLAVGFTTTEAPLRLPGIQLKLAAPDPVSVTGAPVHDVSVLALAVMEGVEFTVTVPVVVSLQPSESVPMIV